MKGRERRREEDEEEEEEEEGTRRGIEQAKNMEGSIIPNPIASRGRVEGNILLLFAYSFILFFSFLFFSRYLVPPRGIEA